jgi:hypothetical protein
VGRAECEPEEEYPPLTATLIVALMPVEAIMTTKHLSRWAMAHA